MTDFSQYEKDESRYTGVCKNVIVAKDVADITGALRTEETITVQGGRTGVTGASVPSGGTVLDVSMLKGVIGYQETDIGYMLDVLPGTTLEELENEIRRTRPGGGAYFFAAEPTEKTATLGGMFSTNAGGPSSLHYGRAAAHVAAADIRLADGKLLRIDRGHFCFDGEGACELPDGGTLRVGASDGLLGLPLLPAPGTDLLDLFAGSEGMLGIVERLRLGLTATSKVKWSLLIFDKDVSSIISFCESVLFAAETWVDCTLVAMDYMDDVSLRLFANFQKQNSLLTRVPAPPEASFGVLIVLESAEDAGIDEALDVILDISESAGFSDQNIWAADSDDLMRKFQMLRHGIPEAINAQLDINRIANPSFMKMGIDIQFGYTGCNISKSLADVTDIMNNTNVLAALFSHIGNKHMHINFLPGNEKEYRVCEVARAELYARTVKSGGILFAENGIGKLKRDILADYVSEDVLTAMRRVKKFFDPEGRLNPGNML